MVSRGIEKSYQSSIGINSMPHIRESLKAIIEEIKTRHNSTIQAVQLDCIACMESFETLSVLGMVGSYLCPTCHDNVIRVEQCCPICERLMNSYVAQTEIGLSDIFYRCDYCSVAAEEKQQERDRIYLAWQTLTMNAKEYRICDAMKLPIPELLQTIIAIPENSSIFARGKSYLGKTHCIYERCRRDVITGKRLKILQPGEFGETVSRLSSDNLTAMQSYIASILMYDVVFFDDIGKERFTERVETELFNIINRRFMEQKICYFTSNENSDSLVKKFHDRQKGEAIINRIREKCVDVIFEKRN